jgi:hypothetical protein
MANADTVMNIRNTQGARKLPNIPFRDVIQPITEYLYPVM